MCSKFCCWIAIGAGVFFLFFRTNHVVDMGVNLDFSQNIVDQNLILGNSCFGIESGD
jgi:hypothetical protein